MLKKNLSLVLVILLALLLVAFVIWFFGKRIQDLEKKKRSPVSFLQKPNVSKDFSKEMKSRYS